MVRLTIDGRELEAEEGTTVLQTALTNGIKVPTLCYHRALRPIGACKLCAVEVTGRGGKPRILLACVLRVREDLKVKTRSDLVTKARSSAFDRLLTMAPESQFIRKLALEHGIEPSPPPDGCIRCHLCVRVCNEVVGARALKMEKRDDRSLIVPTEGVCIGCGTCYNLCPTGAIKLTDEDGRRTISIRDEIIGIHPLVRCEACGKYYASQNFIKHVEERTRSHTDVKTPHLYCPTCAKFFSNRIISSSKLKRRG